MIEVPESLVVARQINDSIRGKVIKAVEAYKTPHKFAFYNGEPAAYSKLLVGKQVEVADGLGIMVEMILQDCRLVIGDGANMRFYDNLSKVPSKHQLYIEFEDQTALVTTIQMYGYMWAFEEGALNNKYYNVAKEKPFVLSSDFNETYFESLRKGLPDKCSAKAFLATEQRIPGLGNGILQDILFNAGIHPKRKINTLSDEEYEGLYYSVKDTLKKMTQEGGRDTEKDLFGNLGRYKTILSKKTINQPCPKCGGEIKKAAYLGGSIYYCEHCQQV